MAENTTIFETKRTLTMCSSRPRSTHIAVRNGRVLGTGTLNELAGWGPYELNKVFADKFVMPGLVEGHAHTLEGVLWAFTYVGYFSRQDPDGVMWQGLSSIKAVVQRLGRIAQNEAYANKPIVAWGFDPIYFHGRRMVTDDLDQVATDRPVIVLHASGHMLTTNSFTLQQAGIDRDTNIEGILKNAQGVLTGELQELAATFAAFDVANVHPFQELGSEKSVMDFGRLAHRAGVTTATDLYSPLSDGAVAGYLTCAERKDFPIRIVPAYGALSGPTQEGIQRLSRLVPRSTEKARFGLVKMMTDGSIQGFTARVNWPGYFNGAPNGIWNAPPQELAAQLLAYHKAGFQIHIHTNGDEAVDVMLDAIEHALSECPRRDHRHTLQHCQMITESQLARAAALGVCCNMFANHLYYWGDQHLAVTLGAERANRLEPIATAERLGVPFAMHSDAPVTPIGPLFTAWCAVNRKTASGVVLGELERIDVMTALRAITLGAAYTLKMDHEIGSIECGKFADFTVLNEDPLADDPDAIRDMPIWGTVLGGTLQPLK